MIITKKWIFHLNNEFFNQIKKRFYNRCCYEFFAYLLITALCLVPTSCSVCQNHKTIFTSKLTGIISDGTSNYLPNQRCEWLIESPDAINLPFITLKFLNKSTECTYDYIMVYNGDSYKSPRLAALSGDSTSISQPQTVRATSGKMLIYLFSDINTEHKGFEASFAIYPCPNNCSGNGECRNNICFCDDAWTGSDCSQPACPHNCEDGHGKCRIATSAKKCNCNWEYIGLGCGMSISTRSEGGWWTIVYNYTDETGSDGRAGHAGVFVDPYFYIFGGYDMNKALGDLLRYEFTTNEWSVLYFYKQPTPRYFHTLTVIKNRGQPYLLLAGGDLGHDKLTNETWIYDIFGSSWERPSIPHRYSLPYMCQHAATSVALDGVDYVYVYGGRTSRSQDEGLTSSMYRFNFAKRRWETIKYDSRGVKDSRLRVATHSMIYDPIDLSLVVFGGFRMDLNHKAEYSSSIFIYKVKENIWAEVIETTSLSRHHPPSLTFHTANLVDNFMVIHGGNTKGNTCFSRETYFYHLRCHKWLQKELSPYIYSRQMILNSGRYSHVSVIYKNSVLLVHGGYNGIVDGTMVAYKLPQFVTNPPASQQHARHKCSQLIIESLCMSNYLSGCTWRGTRCTSSSETMPSCGNICSSMKNCVTCTNFKSYIRNSDYDWEAKECGWCVEDSTCYAMHGHDSRGACSNKNSRSNFEPWWGKSNYTLIEESAQCLMEDFPPGVIAAEYFPHPNFSQPDNVTFLHKILYKFGGQDEWPSSGGEYILDIKGFLRPYQIPYDDNIQLKLLVNNGATDLYLSSSDSPAESRNVVFVESHTRDEEVSELIPVSKHSRYYFHLTFSHIGDSSWEGNFQAEWIFGSSKPQLLKSSVLEPYGSSAAMCNNLTNCLACLTDISCAWCQSKAGCYNRSELALNPLWCRMSDNEFDSNHSGMLFSPKSCTICSDHPTCQICVADLICEWREDNCVRRDASGDGIKESSFCPKPCQDRLDCRSCLTDTRTNLNTQCYWCDTTQKCYKFASYHLMAYPYGQCGYWMNDIEQCPNCSLHKNCTSCLLQYQCGWCSLSSNPLRGVCIEGEFSKLNSCQHLLFPAANLRETWEWSYSFCPDVDECLLEWPTGTVLHDCKPDEDCHNTPDSYECRCQIGFERNGSQCQRTCYEECVHGYCSGPLDYECICDIGWTSKRNTDLISPTSTIYFQPSACDIDCECNLHSTCSAGPGICDTCQHNTRGKNCSQCLRGYFHSFDPRNGCTPCDCNGHGREDVGWCDSSTGECICKDNTEGTWCEMCIEGFYGDASNGGTCYSMCDGRSQITDVTGAFGSWEVAEKKTGSLLRRGMSKNEIAKVECEWTIQFSGLLELSIEKTIRTSCYTNPLLIYDGVPGDNNTILLGGFCGEELESDVIVYARSGSLTARYSDVPPVIRKRPGFNATFRVYPDCPTFDEDSVKSLTNSSYNESKNSLIVNNSIPLMTNITCASVGYPETFGCESNCSWSLGQGECKSGICHCSDAYTGTSCTKLKSELNATLIEQTEWFPTSYFSNSSPTASVGHSLVAVGQNLWLYGGYHYDQGPLDQLWRYSTENKEWRKLSDEAEISATPGSLYYHAAAKHPTQNDGFYIHGGILKDGKTSSQLWIWKEDDGWSKVKVSRSLPAIAGHTLTFCSETKAYLVGGYSSRAGFTHNVWSLDITDLSVHTVRSRHINPPFVYGHSTICDNNLLYVYGGMVKASRHGLPVPTDAFHVFNTTSHYWLPVFLRGKDPVVPFSRAFQSSVVYKSEHFRGMLMFGGRSSSGHTLNEVWLFCLNCNEWINISNEDSRISSSSPVAVIGSKYFIYSGLFDGGIPKGMKVISNIQPCMRVPQRNCSDVEDICLSCICHSSFQVSDKHFCMNGTRAIGNRSCVREVQPQCSFFRDCKSCLSFSPGNKGERTCHWCGINNSQVEGKCHSLHERCKPPNTGITMRRDCNHCLVPSCYLCKSKAKCSWNESETMNSAFGEIMKTYSCHAIKTKEYDYFTPSPYDTTPHIPPPAIPMFDETCPMNCGIFTSCESCLGVRDTHNPWRDCIWSPGLNQCLVPSYVPLLCQSGGHCGTLASHGPKSCPVSDCSLLQCCWQCINEPTCGWLQNGTKGNCVTGSLQGPFVAHNTDYMSSAVWWYYRCPLVDECDEGFHDCLVDDKHKEKCHDLDQGFDCLCQDGYDREDAAKSCLPVCSAGCINGVCGMPDTCVCEFGFTGERCDIECDCNGHSNCRDEQHLDECLQCKHNTTGPQCQHCSFMFVKDATSNRCIPCEEACSGRATNCTSINFPIETDHGPTLNDIYCIGCKGNSQGNRCEKCKSGFFMLDKKCRSCDCNGHSDICDPVTGGLCVCRNHTKTSDSRCEMRSHESSPDNCWRKQCDQCAESYQGNARSGGQCYRQVSIEQEMCFDPVSQSTCLPIDYGSNSHTVSNAFGPSNHVLPAGQAILYALSPKYTNVDIRIMLDVTFGQMSVFISSRPDIFLVRSDPSSGKHIVYPDERMVNVESTKFRSRRNIKDSNINATNAKYKDIFSRDRAHLRSQKKNNYQLYEDYFKIEEDPKNSFSTGRNEVDDSQQNDDPTAKARSQLMNGKNKLKLITINATKFNTFAMFPRVSALVVKGVQNRLVVSIPHVDYDFHSTKFYLIILGGYQVMHVFDDTKDDRFTNDFHAAQKLNVKVIDETAGLLVFRQDQTRIDLFVFFSVFFSCFFLFLAICILIWKSKQTMDVRQARHARHVEMQHMASRPFACVYVFLDDYHTDPLLMKKQHPKKIHNSINPTATTADQNNIPTSSQLDSNTCMFQARSCPVFTSSLKKDDDDDVPGTSSSILSGVRSSRILNHPVSEPTSPRNTQNQIHQDSCHLNLTAKSDPDLICDVGSSSAEKIANLRRASHRAGYVGSSADKLYVFYNTDQGTDHKVPLFNSTSSYIKLTSSGNNKPLPCSGSRTPTHASRTYTKGVQTVVSLDKGGMVRTLSKENVSKGNSLPPIKRKTVGANLDSKNSTTTDRSVTKYRSTPDIPERGVNGVTERKHHSLFERQLSFRKEDVESGREIGTSSGLKSERRKHEKIEKRNVEKYWESGPIACEPTEDGLASATTVILCLPGGSHAPVFACLGTGLVMTHNMYYLPVNDINVTSKTNYKSRTSKIL